MRIFNTVTGININVFINSSLLGCAMKKGNVIPFEECREITKRRKRGRKMSERTTLDAVCEDPNLMREISYEEYLDDSVGLEPLNRGDLLEMTREARRIKAQLGITDEYGEGE
jgi:hypothetical protein